MKLTRQTRANHTTIENDSAADEERMVALKTELAVLDDVRLEIIYGVPSDGPIQFLITTSD
jgi:hypothetical protein